MVVKRSCETDCMANVFLVLHCWNTGSSYVVLIVESMSYSLWNACLACGKGVLFECVYPRYIMSVLLGSCEQSHEQPLSRYPA